MSDVTVIEGGGVSIKQVNNNVTVYDGSALNISDVVQSVVVQPVENTLIISEGVAGSGGSGGTDESLVKRIASFY